MALQELNFSFQADGEVQSIPGKWSHTGVVGSGDMEVLLQRKDLDGKVEIQVVTPVTGFDDVWKRVLNKFVHDTKLGNTVIAINDNNSTPYIVSMRLKQALMEAQGGDAV